MARINAEIANAKAGKPAAIWAKMNSLVDADMIDRLYKASNAGVRVDLVIRGICCLPWEFRVYLKISGSNQLWVVFLSTRVLSFLEMAALYRDLRPKYMCLRPTGCRDSTYRVEHLVPIETPTIHTQILDQIMEANLKDTSQSWNLHPDGTFVRVVAEGKPFSAHEFL